MPRTDWIPSLHLRGRKIRAWDIPTAAYTGAKLGILLALAHNLYHFAYDGDLEPAFLTHRLVELVGFPCTGLILMGSVAAVSNWRKAPQESGRGPGLPDREPQSV